MNITITKTQNPKTKPTDDSKLGFGQIFTDHMFLMNYTEGIGWHDARITPYAPISLDPSCQVLHYGQEIFEGLKCYRTPDNQFQLFRPYANFERMNNSSDRMAMAHLDVEMAMEGLLALLSIEKEWTPHTIGTSLYIRPTMIATDNFLGVSASKTYLFFIILSPSGAYYSSGLAPVKIYTEDAYVRAVRGGVGCAKTGGNYASSILANVHAKHKGFSQVLWLDGVEQRYIEEVGAMNMMFVYDNKKIVTPVLNGSILPGITRDSILQLARTLGYETEEARMCIHDVIADCKSGRITEAFGTGTAAVVSPVSHIAFKEEEIQIGDGNIGKITQSLYDHLTGIQYGVLQDKNNWVLSVK